MAFVTSQKQSVGVNVKGKVSGRYAVLKFIHEILLHVPKTRQHIVKNLKLIMNLLIAMIILRIKQQN